LPGARRRAGHARGRSAYADRRRAGPAALKEMNFKVVIPARLGSTRLPRKVLREVRGRPLVRYVWDAARRARASEVVIATDDAEVRAACAAFGADVQMTSARHASGTDRIHEVAVKRRWGAGTVVVNLQG